MKKQTKEVWRPAVCQCEPLAVGSIYEVSSLGRIRKINSPYELKPTMLRGRGYLVIALTVDGWNKNFRLHRLVAEAFLGAPATPSAEVNHKNGIKDDNRAENLEWCTPLENTTHAIATGLRPRFYASVLNESDVLEIRRMRAAGYKRKYVAEKFGVSVHNIKAIDLRKSWRHI